MWQAPARREQVLRQVPEPLPEPLPEPVLMPGREPLAAGAAAVSGVARQLGGLASAQAACLSARRRWVSAFAPAWVAPAWGGPVVRRQDLAQQATLLPARLGAPDVARPGLDLGLDLGLDAGLDAAERY